MRRCALSKELHALLTAALTLPTKEAADKGVTTFTGVLGWSPWIRNNSVLPVALSMCQSQPTHSKASSHPSHPDLPLNLWSIAYNNRCTGSSSGCNMYCTNQLRWAACSGQAPTWRHCLQGHPSKGCHLQSTKVCAAYFPLADADSAYTRGKSCVAYHVCFYCDHKTSVVCLICYGIFCFLHHQSGCVYQHD